MTLFQILITFVFLSVLLLVVGFYYLMNKREINLHKMTVNTLQNEISNHCLQIHKREKSLNTYDFLKYNLDTSLVAQTEINT